MRAGPSDMSEQSETIAVVGASPFAWLLAGLLASDHSRAVVLVGPAPQPFALRPLPSLSVAPLTRPQSWALLHDATREAVRRLSRIAPRMGERVDLALLAGSPTSRIALGHIRRMAEGFGHPAEPIDRAEQSGIGLRDTWLFDTALFMAAAPRWLASANVTVTHTPEALTVNRDGSATLADTLITRVILADDWAILSHLSADEISAFARVERWVGIETPPHRPLPFRAGFDLDSGAVFAQSAQGTISGAAPDDDGKGIARIAACLAQDPAPRLAARTRFERLVSHDGAPVIGPTRRGQMFVIAGLGPLDLVLAPTLAAIVCGTASPSGAEWSTAHGAALRQPRRPVAEFSPYGGTA